MKPINQDVSTTKTNAKAIERLCIVSGQTKPTHELLRFVEDPSGQIVVDIKQKLGGRGVWLSACPHFIRKARQQKLFAKRLKHKVGVSENLENDVERLLRLKLLQSLSMIRKAGKTINGWHKVEKAAQKENITTLIQARDGAHNGQEKMTALARRFNLDLVASLTIDELSIAFGNKNVVHAALIQCAQTKTWLRDAQRLARFAS